MHVQAHLVGRRAGASASRDRLDRALHVGLEDDLQLLHVAGLDLLVEVVERDLGGLRHLGLALLAAPVLGDLARLLRRPATATNASPASGTPPRPRISTGVDGPGRLDPLALVVDHGADAAVLRAAHERVADVERAFLDQHGRDRAAAAVEPRLDDRALRASRRGWPSARARRPAGGASRAAAGCPPSSWPTPARRSCRRPTPRARGRGRRAPA